MALDITISPLAIDFSLADEEKSFGQMIVLTGATLPIAGPDGQPVQVPVDQYRIPFNKANARQAGEALIALSEDLAEPSRVQIANSLEGVDNAQKAIQDLRG